ncbi:hypothetical protein J7E79_03400 [Bacillus sp. ISL-40]|uniref:hypothetical protein n=1 Tax=unclassified Bacillus (in: firmicutes) TaxID=185979 RepID=UPI001BE925EB|nr:MULTISPECIES: hypothetical protein [unclassified Bacillus (in: firmicutes)]MBT2696481.1 hypothetical protein [Bacillus sp. ISL-40]MBT2741503.1 hypothetical protein [Bacillus sp. ISL-77]
MTNDFQFSNFINDVSLQTKMENVWSNTCGSWENCNEETIQSFLAQCLDYNIDPQYCMSWVEQHKEEIPNWTNVSETSLGWVNQHTSTGSAISITEQDFS